ncbi:MAG: putative lipid II flippase FtsW, partial [Thermodesulfobacteriota bacterium]|nr:putative lipid II flippase FtsW [Thermodesulfobacteriota bacterium]
VLILAGIGIVMVYSASSAIGMKRFDNHLYYMQRQSLFCLISFGVMFAASCFPYRFFKAFVYVLLVAAILLLCAVLVPSLGLEAGGAVRWLSFGSFSFQPSEFVKFVLIIYFAYSMGKKQEMIRDFSVGFMPHVFVFAVFAMLILLQPDFGSVLILGLITWGMMFIAGVRITHLLLPVPCLLPIAYFLVYKVDYRMERIFAFLDPWADPLDTGYQITHSLMAFGSGGIFGKGIGLGMQKFYYLPEPHTDFIFSIIGEELGLAGVLLILLLFSAIIVRGTRIARVTQNCFGSFVAAGLTMSLGIQVLINIGVTMGALPTKGLTLPFLSYGGTSLLMNMACMGVLINIGASAELEEENYAPNE